METTTKITSKIHYLFFNNSDNPKLRNGWWILCFIFFIALTRPIYKPIKQTLTDIGFTEMMLEPLSLTLVLLCSWLCLKLRNQGLGDIGLQLNGRWFVQLFYGNAVGMLMAAMTVGIIIALGGVSLSLNTEVVTQALLEGFYILLIGAALEEVLHRGFLFQRLIDGIGFWPAQLIIALVFASGHWGNPAMSDTTLVLASVDLALVSIVLGLAYYKTRSLALPLGLHLGWNWAQGYLFGFQVSGYEQTGIFTPVLSESPTWINGGSFGLEASIPSIVVELLALLWLIHGVKQVTQSR